MTSDVAKGRPGRARARPNYPILFFAIHTQWEATVHSTVNTDSGSLCYVFIVLIMHSKSIFMKLKPIISFVEHLF